MAHTAPLGPGEATLLLAIRNYQAVPATPPAANGRWLFPPKASELLAEKHGMLDGFHLRASRRTTSSGRTRTTAHLPPAGRTRAPPVGRAGIDATARQLTCPVRFGCRPIPAGATAFYFAPTATTPTTPWLA